MKTMNLPQMSTRKPRFKYQTTSEALPLPNQLQQKFSRHHPNTTWTSDMTYIHTDQGFVYLCVVLNLFARKIVSWQVATKMEQNLIEVKQAVFQYIEGFSNPRRPHSANNLLAPD